MLSSVRKRGQNCTSCTDAMNTCTDASQCIPERALICQVALLLLPGRCFLQGRTHIEVMEQRSIRIRVYVSFKVGDI